MTAYEDLDVVELRDALEEWHRTVCKLAREYRSSHEAGLGTWSSGVGVALDHALSQVRRIEGIIQSGAVA